MSDRYALRLHNVTKRYGKTVALDSVRLDVPRGALMGLIGDNGAGKTTLFSVVTGQVLVDAGEVDVLGSGPFDARSHGARVRVLPQDCAMPPHSSAEQVLRYYARLQGASRAESKREADRVLELVRLGDRRKSRVRQLSHGMKRRLAVAQALLGDPELVLLDEPTGGLDPQLVVEMREILLQQRGRRTLVVSSHILADLEAICDHVAFMESGRCVRAGPVDEIMHRGRIVRVTLKSAPPDLDALATIIEERAGVVDGVELRFAIDPDEDPADACSEVLAQLLAADLKVLEVRLGRSLEAAYLETRTRTRLNPP